MKVETIYKNFMESAVPRTTACRMIHIFCSAWCARVLRLTAGPKSGLPTPVIDYTNLASIEFSTKILDSLSELQKIAKPENWEVLRPYAEKLLDKVLPASSDDAAISGIRADLVALFAKEKEQAARAGEKAKSIFDVLKIQNPYAQEFSQVSTLFATEVSAGRHHPDPLRAEGSARLPGLRHEQDRASGSRRPRQPPEELPGHLSVRDLRDGAADRLAVLRAADSDTETLKSVTRSSASSRRRWRTSPLIDSEVKLKTESSARCHRTPVKQAPGRSL